MDIRSDGQVPAMSGSYVGDDPAKVESLIRDDFLIRLHDMTGKKVK